MYAPNHATHLLSVLLQVLVCALFCDAFLKHYYSIKSYHDIKLEHLAAVYLTLSFNF